MKRISGLAGFLLLAGMATACAPADDTADTMADTGAAAAPAAAPAVTGQARTVHVVLSEWSVAPSETTLAAGPVTFHVMNQGQNQHGLEVQRGSDEWETGNIPAGGTGTVTVNLTPGTYTLYCPIVDSHGNHRQMGMQTTITVQ